MPAPLNLGDDGAVDGFLAAHHLGGPQGARRAASLLLRADNTWAPPALPGTPTGSADGRGEVGDLLQDAGFLYVKTAAGWKRAALSAF